MLFNGIAYCDTGAMKAKMKQLKQANTDQEKQISNLKDQLIEAVTQKEVSSNELRDLTHENQTLQSRVLQLKQESKKEQGTITSEEEKLREELVQSRDESRRYNQSYSTLVNLIKSKIYSQEVSRNMKMGSSLLSNHTTNDNQAQNPDAYLLDVLIDLLKPNTVTPDSKLDVPPNTSSFHPSTSGVGTETLNSFNLTSSEMAGNATDKLSKTKPDHVSNVETMASEKVSNDRKKNNCHMRFSDYIIV